MTRFSYKIEVFVYGTLRRGASRAADESFGAEYVGPARVNGKLYDLGWYPGFLRSDDPEDVVYGDVFAVTPSQLAELDDYEGEGSLYFREEITSIGRAEPLFVYVYGYPVDCIDCRNRIESGDWLYHDKEGV